MLNFDILYFWRFGEDKLDPWRKHCIERALKIYEGCNFKCITTEKEFYGMETISPDYWVDKYDISLESFIPLSDRIRFDYLSEHPNTLYMDTDVWCNKKIQGNKGIEFMSIEAIWNGNDLEGIKRIFSKRNNPKGFLLHLKTEMAKEGTELHGYFEHKPKWRKKIFPGLYGQSACK